MPIGSNRSESAANAELLSSLFGSAPSTAPVNQPARQPRSRSRRASAATAAAVATVMSAAPVVSPSVQAAQAEPQMSSMQSIGDTFGMDTKEVRAIELCARKMELLALRQAVETELADLNRQIERLKRSS